MVKLSPGCLNVGKVDSKGCLGPQQKIKTSPGNFHQVVGRINKYKFYHDGPRGKYRVRTDLVLPNGNTLFSISRIFLTWGGTSTILPKTRSTAGGGISTLVVGLKEGFAKKEELKKCHLEFKKRMQGGMG
jgi:hypothetical protein